MALAYRQKKVWKTWAPMYDRLWGFQRFSLRPTRKFVHQYIQDAGILPQKILDIGCGVGELAFELSQYWPNARILAADYSEGMIERAKKDFSAPNITHLHGSLENIPANQQFDLIVSTHSFPYFPDQQWAATRMRKMLQPDGRLMIIQGNTNNWYDAIWLALIQLGLSKANFCSVKQVKAFLQTGGFEIGTVQRVKTAFFIPSIYLVEGINSVKTISN